jgi:pilus assembly protein Flp/PilA
MFSHLVAKMKGEKGQALAEYGLILALIAVICVGALTLLGGNVNTTLGTIASAL